MTTFAQLSIDFGIKPSQLMIDDKAAATIVDEIIGERPTKPVTRSIRKPRSTVPTTDVDLFEFVDAQVAGTAS